MQKIFYKLSFIFILFPMSVFAQQRLPFSDKTVELEGGSLLMPYTKGEVKKNIRGDYKPIFDKICSIITAWDSINPPQGMEIDCFGYEKRLEIYFRNYMYAGGQRFPEEGGPHLDIYVNDPLKTVGFSVAPGIYLCPQKTADFYGFPVYDIGKGGEVTIVTKTKIPLYIPVSQEEYLKTLIAEEEKKASKYSPPKSQDYQATLQEMEKTYQALLKTDKETAKEFKQQMDEFKEEINQKKDENQSFIDPVFVLKNKLSAMTEEEKERNAYYGGDDISGLIPYEQKEYGDALIRINPALMQETSKNGVHLFVISWTISSDNMNKDKPRFYDKGSKGVYHVDYLMSKLYENREIWNEIFSML